MPAMSDPRPLTGEPVSLDLLNTRWTRDGTRQDLLTGTDGLQIWLKANGLDTRFSADDATLERTLAARDALAALVASPGDKDALRRVDEVLDHGRIRATLDAGGWARRRSSPTRPGVRDGRRPAAISICCAPPRTAFGSARTKRACSTSSTPPATEPAAGAPWRSAGTGRRRPGTTRAAARAEAPGSFPYGTRLAMAGLRHDNFPHLPTLHKPLLLAKG